MNKSQRIYMSTGYTGNDSQDKHIKVKLEQNVDTLEFFSMSFGTTDAYQNFNADYGVLVGKIIANGGIGIPNAKISVFIPLTDDDAANGEIASVYPYKTPRDKNNDGKRYNLLPRVSKIDSKGIINPKQPFGSFPIKEEIVGNDLFLNVYKKYYKYTALSNEFGDYMIFGVPTGVQIIHMSVDITDIGDFSMNPASMVTNLGYSPNLFNDNNTRLKPSSDLDDLPNIETQEINVDVVPFWGDMDNFEIGITRQDFRIRAELKNTFILFGSAFTDSSNSMYGSDDAGDNNNAHIKELYRITNTSDLDSTAKRAGKITEKIYYYPNDISDETIDAGDAASDGSDMKLLNPSEYTVHKNNGSFAFIVNCNRTKVVNIDGENVVIDGNSPNGLFTEFRGFVTLEIANSDAPINIPDAQIANDAKLNPRRGRLKFPQHGIKGGSFNYLEYGETKRWRLQNYKFSYNKFYSFSRFHATTHNSAINAVNHRETNDVLHGSFNNDLGLNDANWQTGLIRRDGNSPNYFPINYNGMFGANWLNLGIYFPQYGQLMSGFNNNDMVSIQTSDNFLYQEPRKGNDGNDYYLYTNTQSIAAGEKNTALFSRSDLHWTDFIEVPIEDIQFINNQTNGINYNGTLNNDLAGYYRNGNYSPNLDFELDSDNPNYWDTICPWNGGKLNGNPNNNNDPLTYFFKGVNGSDCIQHLFDLGLVD